MTGYAAHIKYVLWAELIIFGALFVCRIATNIHDEIFEAGRTAERAAGKTSEENEGGSDSGGGISRVRFPEQAEQHLWQLVAKLMPHVEIIPDDG